MGAIALAVLSTWAIGCPGGNFLTKRPAFTGLSTNFESLLPSKYKVNLVTVLVYRAFHICSSYAHFHDQLCNIKRFLQQNCFPKHLIDKLIKKFLDGQYIPKIRPATVSKLPVIFCLPYLVHLVSSSTSSISTVSG